MDIPKSLKSRSADPSDNRLQAHENATKKAELPLIRFHDLRHTFATHAMANDVDAKTLSSILGHTEASFTLDTYTHVTTDMQKNAATIIGGFMKNLLGEELKPCRKEGNTDQAH